MKKRRWMALALACTMIFTAGCQKGGKETAEVRDNQETKESQTETAKTEVPNTENTESQEEPVTIKFANYAVLEEGNSAFWEKIKTDFEAENPNISIEWITAPFGEMVQQVINMAGGGEYVDLIFGELDWTPTLADSGIACPVSDIMSAEYLADFYPNVLEAHSIDHVLYSLPLYVGPYILYINKDLFEQAGLDASNPPTTYDEMLKCAEKLSELKDADGNQVYAFGQTTASVPVSGASLTSMVFNFGGQVLDENGKLSCDNEGFKQAFEMLKLLDEKGYNPQNAKLKDLRNLFALGRLAMYYDQSWGFAGIKPINPESEAFTVTAKPLKGGSGTGQSILQSHCLMMVDNGEARKKAVEKLVEYIITNDNLSYRMSNETLAYPAKKSMEHAVDGSLILKGAAGSEANTKTQVFIPQNSDLNLELCALAQAVTVGKTDVDKAIADFKKAAEMILD